MEFKVKHGEKKFYIGEDEQHTQAMMTYVPTGTTGFIIDHTEVTDESIKGQGAGKQMVMASVEYARNNELKIVPLCPFAKSVFDKNPEIRDVLK